MTIPIAGGNILHGWEGFGCTLGGASIAGVSRNCEREGGGGEALVAMYVDRWIGGYIGRELGMEIDLYKITNVQTD